MIIRLLFTILHAVLWAAKDAGDIKAGKSINHPIRWALRAGIEVVASLVLLWPYQWQNILVTIGCAFLFSAVFRFALNTMRGKPWRYISPSSWYDWQSLRIAWGRRMDRTELVEGWHVYFAAMTSIRAGLMAYVFELLVFWVLLYLSLAC